MAWPPPPEPGKVVTTGTTGVISNHYDHIIWTARIEKEAAINGKTQNTKFPGAAIRSAVRVQSQPIAPHKMDAANRTGHLDVEKLGFRGHQATQVHREVAALKCGPKGIHALPETAQHSKDWAMSTGSRLPAMRSAPDLSHASTEYPAQRQVLIDAAEARLKRREAKVTQAEERVQKALNAQAKFFCKGPIGKKYYLPNGETDATAFQNFFILATNGVPIHKANPKSDEVILRDKQGVLVDAWKSSGSNNPELRVGNKCWHELPKLPGQKF